jgi:hexosaminidase
MKKPIVSACVRVLSSGLTVVLGFALSDVAAAIPNTIPAVQSWKAGTGTMVVTSSSRIVVNTADAAALTADANTFAQDLNGLKGWALTVTTGTLANAGDVFLRLGATDTTIGTEGYFMTTTTYIDINARAAAGVFYGTRTLLQMLKASTTVNRDTIKDWPKGKWRGEMVDAGRKYYTVAWLQTLIRDLAYVKMNTFHFHLSDGLSATNNGGFRLQSAKHPEITSTQYYSDAEIQSLNALAAKYHVTIIPEIDLPGHVNWLYANHRNLLLSSQVLGSQYWALDLSKDTVYSFVNDILNEMIPKFPGPFWHLGADEYMFIAEYATFSQLTTWATSHYGSGAHANDCYRHFVNWADSIVKSKGKTMITWNDVMLGITGTKVGACTLVNDIILDHWGALNWIGWGGTYPDAEHNLGYAMLNCSWDLFYILTTGSKTTGNPQLVYEGPAPFPAGGWEIYTFAGANLPQGDAHIMGGKFPVWGDNPNAETEAQVWTNTFMLNRAVAQKCWGSPKIQSAYSGFQPMANTIGRTPVPVVSVKNPVAPIRLASGKILSAQIFDLRGALLKTVIGDDFRTVSTASGDAYQLIGSDRKLTTGSYLCRFKGINGFERTEKILMVR